MACLLNQKRARAARPATRSAGPAPARNVIGGASASSYNVLIFTDDNTVIGNYIGTNAAGIAALLTLQTGTGVGLQNGAQDNTIRGNVVSGVGVGFDLNTTSSNTVAGNLIGTDYTGAVGIGNVEYGVLLHHSATNNTIGGVTASDRNVVADNGVFGIYVIQDIAGDTTSANVIEGNYVGTNAAGTAALGNSLYGIELAGGTTTNTIGGSAAVPATLCRATAIAAFS